MGKEGVVVSCPVLIQVQDGGVIAIPTRDGWIFGYKLHLTCTRTAIGEIVVPLTTTDDVTTTANVLKPDVCISL
jgi:hypothetical protein